MLSLASTSPNEALRSSATMDSQDEVVRTPDVDNGGMMKDATVTRPPNDAGLKGLFSKAIDQMKDEEEDETELDNRSILKDTTTAKKTKEASLKGFFSKAIKQKRDDVDDEDATVVSMLSFANKVASMAGLQRQKDKKDKKRQQKEEDDASETPTSPKPTRVVPIAADEGGLDDSANHSVYYDFVVCSHNQISKSDSTKSLSRTHSGSTLSSSASPDDQKTSVRRGNSQTRSSARRKTLRSSRLANDMSPRRSTRDTKETLRNSTGSRRSSKARRVKSDGLSSSKSSPALGRSGHGHKRVSSDSTMKRTKRRSRSSLTSLSSDKKRLLDDDDDLDSKRNWAPASEKKRSSRRSGSRPVGLDDSGMSGSRRRSSKKSPSRNLGRAEDGRRRSSLAVNRYQVQAQQLAAQLLQEEDQEKPADNVEGEEPGTGIVNDEVDPELVEPSVVNGDDAEPELAGKAGEKTKKKKSSKKKKKRGIPKGSSDKDISDLGAAIKKSSSAAGIIGLLKGKTKTNQPGKDSSSKTSLKRASSYSE
ncbi:expressed unknown protein [Seminavis robusta]|uniref:Uncharacterized protein n=1 Tax=Seminavis robusta TaxID=568900 RepID=A0A9N8F0E7_9STRA|nr:expressed unknown protein [Seminavis robusta]|eukprot:Sro2437_g327660.1 n/a (533) ;mRNA; r:10117-11715